MDFQRLELPLNRYTGAKPQRPLKTDKKKNTTVMSFTLQFNQKSHSPSLTQLLSSRFVYRLYIEYLFCFRISCFLMSSAALLLTKAS